MLDNISTPDWVKNAIFYQIFPDRFSKSSSISKPNNLEPWESPPSQYGFKGGDLVGIMEKLDYLKDLGINAIYLNPVFSSASNHRYHTHDYYQVDPLLGGNEALDNLLKRAHQQNIRIILDGVFNHASRGFYQFHHIMECGQSSPYLDWFKIHKFPLNAYQGKPNYACWSGLPALPEFDIANYRVRKYLLDIAKHWIDKGIDGWRLDVAYCISADFWCEFREIIKQANPDAYILGEIPWEATEYLQGDQFDAVMNYQFTQACLGYFAGDNINWEVEQNMMGLPKTEVLNSRSFMKRMEDLYSLYPKQVAQAQFNLLSSHDMPRFITLASSDNLNHKLAVLFQMTYPGAPSIYYGEEIGMRGGIAGRPEPSRAAFVWDHRQWDNEMREFYKSCIQIRRNHPCLRTGDFKTLYTDEQVISYIRSGDEQLSIVIINSSENPVRFKLPANQLDLSERLWVNLLGDGKIIQFDPDSGGPVLPPQSGVILIPAE